MALSEVRTQLYLPREQYRKVKQMAQKRHASFAQLVREAIEQLLRKEETRWDEDPISRHIGMFSGDKDLSRHHDRYIYSD